MTLGKSNKAQLAYAYAHVGLYFAVCCMLYSIQFHSFKHQLACTYQNTLERNCWKSAKAQNMLRPIKKTCFQFLDRIHMILFAEKGLVSLSCSTSRCFFF